MAKNSKSESDKVFTAEISAKIARTDDGEKILFQIPLAQYPNLTRLDAVAIQDVLTQMLQKLVDLGYLGVAMRSGENVLKEIEALKATIRK